VVLMAMGRGAIVNMMRKHKMKVASSTALELVSIPAVLGVILWCKYFMEAQEYTIKSNFLYQDTNSTILLVKNGRMSTKKNNKHIKNSCFLITNRVVQRDLTIEHTGTKNMLADVNMKPVQRELFRVFHHETMGVPMEYDDDMERINTYPLLMPKVKTERLTISDRELPKEIGILASIKQNEKHAVKTTRVFHGVEKRNRFPRDPRRW
jgi:hypothetical protein